MNERDQMNWKQFTVRMVEALRWPAALIAVVVILREPLGLIVNKLLATMS